MDKRNLVEGLQKAFNTDDRQRNTSDTSDVEYKKNEEELSTEVLKYGQLHRQSAIFRFLPVPPEAVHMPEVYVCG